MAPAQLARLLLLGQVLQGHIEGGVQRGRAGGLRLADGLLERRPVRGEPLEDRGPLVELHDLGGVVGSQGVHQPQGRLADDRELLLHGGRGVDHDDQREVQAAPREERHLLLHPVLQDLEVRLRQVRDVAVAAVGDADVQVDHLDAGLEDQARLPRLAGG